MKCFNSIIEYIHCILYRAIKCFIYNNKLTVIYALGFIRITEIHLANMKDREVSIADAPPLEDWDPW